MMNPTEAEGTFVDMDQLSPLERDEVVKKGFVPVEENMQDYARRMSRKQLSDTKSLSVNLEKEQRKFRQKETARKNRLAKRRALKKRGNVSKKNNRK